MTIYGFIGTGHLGSMLVRKFIETGAIEADDILASNRTKEKVESLAKATGICPASNIVVAQRSDFIFLCVRPLEVRDVINELGYLLTPEKLLVSVAGDVSINSLCTQCQSRVIRAFPSMASERLKGVTLLAYGDNATIIDKNTITNLFNAIGDSINVSEKDFDILADLTSCAPGYIAALMNEFVLAATRKRVPPELAERLVKQTMIGTTMLLGEESFQGLIRSVATIGGITEAGIKVIQSDASEMFDRLFVATESKHDLVKRKLDQNNNI
jgi:competence protein ComER